jgi:hypothetical protein
MSRGNETADLHTVRSWQRRVEWASGLNAVVGIWLIASPFLLGFTDEDPYWSDVIFGTFVFMLALTRWGRLFR